MTSKIPSQPPDSNPLGISKGGIGDEKETIRIVGQTEWLQFFDDLRRGANLTLGPSLIFTFYTSAELIADTPAASDNEGGQVYVSDTGVMAYSNGIDWLNLTTGAIIA